MLAQRLRRRMSQSSSTVLAVTDLTIASYRLVRFAVLVAQPSDGEVILVSTYGGTAVKRSEPPVDPALASSHGLRLEASLRHEGHLLERQRQWCADHGVRCRAELVERGSWSDFVLESARRARADLILLGSFLLGSDGRVLPDEMRKLADDAPCPVSVVRMPAFWVF